MAKVVINGSDGAGPEKHISVDLPANSHKSKKSVKEDKPDKVVPKTGKAVQRKKRWYERGHVVLKGEDAQSVWSYLVVDVIIPKTQDLIVDFFQQGISRLVYGDATPRVARQTKQRTAYGSFSKPSSNPISREPMTPKARAGHRFDEIILETRGEAELTLERLGDLISQYEVATVSDLYQMVDISGTFVDEQWGWTDLRSAQIRRVREGYFLDMPEPIHLD